MKKSVIFCIVGIIIGVLSTNIISIKGETNNIESNAVIYENNTTVKSALDNLYSKVADLTSYGNATSSTILSGYTALVNGEKITGSYTCPTCDYTNYVAKSNITDKSGTEYVTTLGNSSTTLNGYYNLSNYKVSCPSGYSSCSSCCSSCTSQGYYSSCSSCCSASSLSETTLWSNNDTSSTFSSQTVSLSRSISNFSYLKFYYRTHKNQSIYKSVMYPVSNINYSSSPSGIQYGLLVVLSSSNGSTLMCRKVYIVDNSTIKFDQGGNCNVSNDSSWIIPVTIYGVG